MKTGINVPAARQLPSGSWFCRVRVNGQDISITRPTEREAVAEAMAIKAGIRKAEKQPRRKTLTAAIDAYIEARQNVLSPSTIRGYRAYQRLRFQQMMQRDIFSITQDQWQRAVNLEAKSVSAKTLKNAWGFVSSVLADAGAEKVCVRLPQVVPNQRPWLTPEQIPVFVEAVRGRSVEIPALLALSSLRRSELLNLRWQDVDLERGVLHINGAAVYDENGVMIHKPETKNPSSRRVVPMTPPLRSALERAEKTGEYVVTMRPEGIFKHINRVCRENNLPEVGFHGLRHSFASLALHVGMKEEVAMEIGGWADYQTMKRIYTHISQTDKQSETRRYLEFYESAVPEAENGNENGNEP